MKKPGAVLSLVLGLAAGVHAQELTARAWADSTDFVVGDPITVHVSITHNGQARITPLLGDTLGVFHVLSRHPLEMDDTVAITRIIVAVYDSGTAVLPPLQFAYSLPPDTVQRMVATNPLIFTIHLVEVDTTKDIRDIRPPLAIPLTVAEISLIIGVIVGAGLLVYAFMYFRKRKKAHLLEEEYLPPPKPAHVQALEELAALKDKRLWQQGLIKPYYTEVSEIVRRYFENRFGFLSLEKTTDETLNDLRVFPVAQQILPQAETLLRRADLVKFAKYQPGVAEHEETLALAFEIVDRTKVIQPSAAPQESETSNVPEAVHV